MGNCPSMPAKSKRGRDRRAAWWCSSTSTTAKVIRVDGRLEEYEAAVPAGHVAARSPGCYVCSGEAMEVGARPPVVAEGEELRPGELYFLLPVAYCHRPLSLPDLCLFAAKASTALHQSL